MSPKPSTSNLKALINAIISNGKTCNLRTVVQTLSDFEKEVKHYRGDAEIQLLLAEAYRHALEPFGVAKKFRDCEQMISKIEGILKSQSKSEDLQEFYSEALSALIYHYIMNEMDKEVHRTLTKCGNFARKHQTNPFVQFNYAMSLSQVAEYFSEKENKDIT